MRLFYGIALQQGSGALPRTSPKIAARCAGGWLQRWQRPSVQELLAREKVVVEKFAR